MGGNMNPWCYSLSESIADDAFQTVDNLPDGKEKNQPNLKYLMDYLIKLYIN